MSEKHNFFADNNAEKQIDSKKVAALNDKLRKTFQGGQVMMTRGIQALDADMVGNILDAVRRADNFNADNDPYGEHDFGSVLVEGNKCFWKIDYYDKQLQYHSQDKSDPNVTTRVLTIMLAEEY
ncbi:MAG: DUF3768 domain-containing protein [Desulfobacteraceae bacterium]|nr:DUF3768 domain-containing protein [Desulfobacteraceae bacterium]MBC2756298.1 DUF3768 domain-containing protein [Desulfobacteraceae bacterium]